MIGLLRRLLGRPKAPTSEDQASLDPEQFIYIKIPGDIQPLARGERFEDPLDEALRTAGLGSVSGGGSQLDDPYPDGRSRVAFCGIDVDVADRDRALVLIRQKLQELDAPESTEIHYTVGTTMLLDQLARGTWQQGLPRSFKHPGFGV